MLLTFVIHLITFAAALRVTRLITHDTITDPFRNKIGEKFGWDSLIYELITCPWCAGFWVCALAVPLAVLAGANLPGLNDAFEIGSLIFAQSYLVGYASARVNSRFSD